MEKTIGLITNFGDRFVLARGLALRNHPISTILNDAKDHVFLHVVSMNPNPNEVKIPKDRYVGNIPIYYFRTYVGAATKALKGGLISVDGLQSVVDQSLVDYALKDDKHMALPHVADELDRDVKAARNLITTVRQEILYKEMSERADRIVSNPAKEPAM